ncbi:ABC transporter substrate-binding protein [Actinocorallia sp. A-T 12471]|uniref:ABC transporter substrate-binding protein n=1 Tax=Actinocorallia sp. A-T 12471 TaxID=3089813 RepID=UPI0029D364F5|nr:ABC transporter substrate-binding protein [Actinocorallia sp. A-T 12471]MDX6741516.1 ABC transporter substrate-binding protein [Actinocorallia sp. A-T 12471]
MAPPTLWFTRCPVPTATGIAADLGWLSDEFAPDGITVQSLQDGVSPEEAETHYTHALEGLFREGGNVPALWARARGERTRLLGLTWIEERQAILTRRGEPVTSLDGLRLAVPRRDIPIDFWRAMALQGFAGALRAEGRDLADAALVEVEAARRAPQWEAELAALAKGEVDAVYVKGALAVEAALRFDADVAIDLDALPDRRARINNGTPRPITVHQTLLDERPELVVRFLAVLLRAADWAAREPAELRRILSAETGAGSDAVARAYVHQPLHPDLSDERLDLLAEQERFLRAHGFLAEAVDVRAWADFAPLTAAQELIRKETP